MCAVANADQGVAECLLGQQWPSISQWRQHLYVLHIQNTCVCVHIHASMMMVHVWGKEGQHASEAEYLSPHSFFLSLPSFHSFLSFFFLEQELCLAWKLPNRADRLANEPQRFAYMFLQSIRIMNLWIFTIMPTFIFYVDPWWIEPGFSCLHSKQFTEWAISLAQHTGPLTDLHVKIHKELCIESLNYFSTY